MSNINNDVPSQFYRGVQADYSDVVENVEGASYVTWAITMARSGRPAQTVVEFDNGQQFLEIFGGAAVAVDTVTEEGVTRRSWLPVLNPRNQPIPVAMLNVRDLNDAINRCRAKSIAMATGHTLSLYSKGMAAAAFAEEVNVYPSDDLAVVAPKVMEKRDKQGRLKATYLGWPEAVAAASITDPSFRWEVLFSDVVDKASGQVVRRPYRDGPGEGYIVSVRLTYQGREHTEHLPILGVDTVQTKNGPKQMEHRPNLTPTVADWNASVMRCLAKGIAVATGYGLSIYAGEDIERLTAGGVFAEPTYGSGGGSPPPARDPSPPAPPAVEEASEDLGPRHQMLGSINELVVVTATEPAKMLEAFGLKGPIESLDDSSLLRIHEGLVAKKRRMDAKKAATEAAPTAKA